ncbi:MAG: hypothetical protein WC974_04945 [Thermoplasmata archaeon]
MQEIKFNTGIKISVILCCLMMAGSIGAFFYPTPSQNGVVVSKQNFNIGNITVSIKGELPSVPSELYSLQTINLSIGKERAKMIAEDAFGIAVGESDPPQIFECNYTWIINNGSKEVRVYYSGYIKYEDTIKMSLRVHYQPTDFPHVDKCIEIANQYVANLTHKGYVPTGLQISFKNVVNDTTMKYESDGIKEYVDNIHINYDITYDNISVWGPTGKFRVYIGPGGDVIGFFGNIWNVEPATKRKVLTPEQAIEKLKSKFDSGIKSILIESIRLVYYAPIPEEVSIFEPAYIIGGREYGNNETMECEFGEIISAIA